MGKASEGMESVQDVPRQFGQTSCSLYVADSVVDSVALGGLGARETIALHLKVAWDLSVASAFVC